MPASNSALIATTPALAKGAAMTYEQIVEYTLAELDRLLADSSFEGV